MKHKYYIGVVIMTFLTVAALLATVKSAQASTAGLVFPVLGSTTYSDDYLASRANGPHHATDIFAKKGTPVVSATDGVIRYAPNPEPSWGYMVQIISNSGWEYNYIHLNNDTPGTDDGRGGPMHAYAPGIRAGERVKKGQLIGWVGDSGNAESTPPHLHFERYKPDGTPTNPYHTLRVMPVITKPAPAAQQADEILPNTERKDGLHIALGDVAGDEGVETVIGVAKKPWVSVYDQNNVLIHKFLAYSSNYRGGVDVATGDVNNDGYDEIITTTGGAGMPRVRIFKADGTMLNQFNAYEATMRSGMTVSTGDIDGDGINDIVIGPRIGGGSTVKVFRYDSSDITSFLTGSVNYSGGVDVAATDIDGDNKAEIITGYLDTINPSVKVFRADGTVVRKTLPLVANHRGGLRVDTGRLNGKNVIITVATTNYAPLVTIYDAITGSRVYSEHYIEEWWRGTYDISISQQGDIKAATGYNRRDSVRPVNVR